MSRHQKILNRLTKIAEDIAPTANARVVAAVYVGGKEIALGINKDKTHPKAEEFKKNPFAIFLHAEVSAVINAMKRINYTDLEGATMYIARAKWDHPSKRNIVCGNAKPCLGCAAAMKAYGFKRVFYTNDDKGFTCEKLG